MFNTSDEILLAFADYCEGKLNEYEGSRYDLSEFVGVHNSFVDTLYQEALRMMEEPPNGVLIDVLNLNLMTMVSSVSARFEEKYRPD